MLLNPTKATNAQPKKHNGTIRLETMGGLLQTMETLRWLACRVQQLAIWMEVALIWKDNGHGIGMGSFNAFFLGFIDTNPFSLYSVVQKNSCMFEFPAFLPPTNLGLPMHSPPALTEHVSLNLARLFLLDPVHLSYNQRLASLLLIVDSFQIPF